MYLAGHIFTAILRKILSVTPTTINYLSAILVIIVISPQNNLYLMFVESQQLANITQTTGTLSQQRDRPAATSSGDLIVYRDGWNGSDASDRVDICNMTNRSWTTATLSIPRAGLTTTTSGNLVFFGGGTNNTAVYAQVDIYNTSAGSWSTATLIQARCFLAATSIGNLVLFGGGDNATNCSSNVVDIYNVTDNTWTIATLSQGRHFLAATSLASRYALFGGGSSIFISSLLSAKWISLTCGMECGIQQPSVKLAII
jgi:hypothetical protein